MSKPILFIDMDNVIVDFDASTDIPMHEKEQYNHPAIYKPGFFINLPIMPGALKFVNKIVEEDYWDVRILTQPVALSPVSYMEKAQWISKYFPKLETKITMTQDKLSLKGEVLIDDNVKWKDFNGQFILFNYKDSINEFNRIKKLITMEDY